jgi:hypothetical protein
MMPYQSYQLYQAERPKTAAEIRRADEQIGHVAENVSRLWQQATRPVARLRGQGRRGHQARLSGRSTPEAACRGTRQALLARQR